VALASRVPIEANQLRVRGAPYFLTDGTVRNSFELHLVNKRPDRARLCVHAGARPDIDVIVAQSCVELGPLESARVPVLTVVRDADWRGPFDLALSVDDGSERAREITARIVGPLRAAARR
jgi:hypothetical protein